MDDHSILNEMPIPFLPYITIIILVLRLVHKKTHTQKIGKISSDFVEFMHINVQYLAYCKQTKMMIGGMGMNTIVEIQGTVQKVIIRDIRDGYTSFLIKTEQEKIIFCTGNILPLEEGIHVKVRGNLQTDNLHGKQLTHTDVKRVFLDENDLLRYILKSNAGIGVTVAKEMIRLIGPTLLEDALEINFEERLLKIRGIRRLQAQKITAVLRKQQLEQSLFDYLLRHGGEYKDFAIINRKYGYEALQMLKEKPYEIGRKNGVKFLTCDSIAKENGALAHDTDRLEYGIRWALQNGASKGHTYLKRQDLLRDAQDLLKNAIFPQRVSFAALQLGVEFALRSGVIKEGDRYYLTTLRDAEIQVAGHLSRLLFESGEDFPEYSINLAKSVAAKLKIDFAEEQLDAFVLLKSPGVKALLGGPGTGKTTVIRGLVEGFLLMQPEGQITLCAPTGRAAQRLAEATGREASTIHRLHELSKKNLKEKTKSVSGTKMYVIDEASMINIEMANMLLSEIENGSIVIFVGDVDQLPAIGAGNFLADLGQYNQIPTIELTQVFRQAGASVTLQNAKLINLGISKLEEGMDFQMIQANDDEMLDIIPKAFIKYFDAQDPYKVQALACTRQLVNQLNTILQNAVNPAKGGIRYGGRTFRTGDKILMVRNNYKLGYFNGDIGKIDSILPGDYIKIRINQLEIMMTLDELEDMDLGYAMTVHKAQGSEYQVVLLALTSTPQNMLSRKILYTGMTRGKGKVILIAKQASVAMAVANNEEQRNSMLIRRLEAINGKLGDRRNMLNGTA